MIRVSDIARTKKAISPMAISMTISVVGIIQTVIDYGDPDGIDLLR